MSSFEVETAEGLQRADDYDDAAEFGNPLAVGVEGVSPKPRRARQLFLPTADSSCQS